MIARLRPRWIERPDEVAEVASRCASAGRLALDTEADSLHSYFHKVCLVQVTAGEENFILDPLALGADHLAPLWEVVSDESIAVVMHGADYDVRVLDRDYGARVGGLEDTQIMAQLLGEERTGLGFLLERELGVVQNKRYQRANWARRPLPPPMLAYAAADTAFVERLAELLAQRLRSLGRWSWAEEEFRRLEGVRYTPPPPYKLGFERLKGSRALRGAARDRLFSLYCWREERAMALDVPPFKIVGNRSLVVLAESPPDSLGGVAEVEGLGKRLARRWGREILAALAAPCEAPARATPPRGEHREPSVRRRLDRLAAARNRVAAELGLLPGLVCPRSLLVSLAGAEPAPRNGAELAVAGLEGWRLELLGSVFAEALGKPR